jgi:hypothetical protein
MKDWTEGDPRGVSGGQEGLGEPEIVRGSKNQLMGGLR